jgi:hypothetical protein
VYSAAASATTTAVATVMRVATFTGLPRSSSESV